MIHHLGLQNDNSGADCKTFTHSLQRGTIKDPERLIEKIIRKKADEPSREYTLQNYRENVTDLVGVRAMHLYKDDWVLIDQAIRDTWELHEKPKAYIRRGDPEGDFAGRDCLVEPHPMGYRSIHYTVKSQPTKNVVVAEIQVRTIFEEGWCEINHQLSYSQGQGNDLIAGYLSIFNRQAGSADEMGTYIKVLKQALDEQTKALEVAKGEQVEAVRKLESRTKELKVSEKEKSELQQLVDKVKRGAESSTAPFVYSSLKDSSPYQMSSDFQKPNIGSAILRASAAAALCTECGDVLPISFVASSIVNSSGICSRMSIEKSKQAVIAER